MSSGRQRIKWRRNIAENFNRLSRVHERYRQTTDRQTDDIRQTDGWTTTYSEHEHEFTFAKNLGFSSPGFTVHTDVSQKAKLRFNVSPDVFVRNMVYIQIMTLCNAYAIIIKFVCNRMCISVPCTINYVFDVE